MYYEIIANGSLATRVGVDKLNLDQNLMFETSVVEG